MHTSVVRSDAVTFEGGETCLIVPLYEKDFPLNSDLLSEADELTLQALADKEVITGKALSCFYLPAPSGAYKGVLLAGLGKAEKFSAEVLRRTAGKACELLKSHRVTHAYLDVSHFDDLPVPAFLEGLVLGQYDFDVYKSRKPDEPAPAKVDRVTVAVSKGADAARVEAECRLAVLMCLSANGARHLGNTSPNEMTPAALADFARGIAEKSRAECTVLEPAQMAALGMNALLGVGRGSSHPPCLIILRYHHSDAAKTLAIVGKGITFDTGGISIKPVTRMHEMKYDMSGAAAVLCAMMTILEIKPAVNVVCVAPAAENKTGSDAQVPGDIVKAYNGKTIEVNDTDAEGRLILADALSFAVDKFKPAAIVDIATLTGACVVALGHYAAGVMGTDAALIDELIRAGERTGERLWQFPLWDDYGKLIEGTHADLCNIGPKGEAGVIVGGYFLKHFVGETPWAHIDIAGPVYGGKHIPHLDPKHATGFGVRLLTQWILDQAEMGA